MHDGREIYDARYYAQALHRPHWFRNNEVKRERRWEAVLRMVRPEKSDIVLDLGCAAGEHACRMAALSREVIAVDSSPAAIALGRERDARHANVRFLQADATAMPMIAAASIDKAMAIDFVEHLTDADLDAAQNELWRLLKPGGTFSLYTPCATHYVERLKAKNFILTQIPGHIGVRSPNQYRAIFARLPWRVQSSFFVASSYPLFRALDHLFMRAPLIGPWFRFRYCLVLQKPDDA